MSEKEKKEPDVKLNATMKDIKLYLQIEIIIQFEGKNVQKSRSRVHVQEKIRDFVNTYMALY